MIYYDVFTILSNLHSQKWIKISLFVSSVTCIETHIFVPSFSISHVFISIIKLLCCLLLIGKLLTLIIQHYNKCNQHHLYTIFEKIPSFTCFIFDHTRLQCITLSTREGVLSPIYKVNRLSVLVYVPETRFKSTCVVYADNHAGISGKLYVYLPGWDTNVCRGCFVSVDLCLVTSLNLRLNNQY